MSFIGQAFSKRFKFRATALALGAALLFSHNISQRAEAFQIFSETPESQEQYMPVFSQGDINLGENKEEPAEFDDDTTDISGEIKVVPCGITAGIKIDTEGILVLGLDYVNSENGMAHKPAEGKLKPGDMLLSINGTEISTNGQLSTEIKNSQGELSFKIKRDNEVLDVFITPAKSVEDNTNKIGVWVRDSTQGIGTITYVNPESGKFGALGHGILDVDTKKLMSIRTGEVRGAGVHSIKKGKKGSPGELVGDLNLGEYFGRVSINNQYGIYGITDESLSWLSKEPVSIATQEKVVTGPAVILSSIDSSEVTEYKAVIETVNKYSTDDSKGMVIRITDERLISLTNGIVQGMSGSPILQDGRLVGAVTHVFVQDPTKGYGIFIENMLKQEKSF